MHICHHIHNIYPQKVLCIRLNYHLNWYLQAGIEYEFQEATNTALSPADAEKPEADRKVHSSDDKARGSRKNKETVPDTKPSKTTANQIGKIEATETKRRKVEVSPPAPTTASGRPRRVKKA